MSCFELPPGQRVLREFTIRRDQRGCWIAREAHDLIGGVFISRKEAIRFALSEADGDAARVHIEPTSDTLTVIGP